MQRESDPAPTIMRSRKVLIAIVTVSLLAHLLAVALSTTLLSDIRWLNYPVHSAIEIAGSFIAIWVSLVLFSLEKSAIGTSYNIPIAAALLGMGILDGFHALTEIGHQFVWLHTAAILWGGILFSFVWIPDGLRDYFSVIWVKGILLLSLMIGVTALVSERLVPEMLIFHPDGSSTFNQLSVTLNIAGGVLFLLAGLRLVLLYSKSGNTDDLLFFLHCTLFGLAAIMFEISRPWDLSWWGWHLLRLGAYVVALYYVLKIEQSLYQTIMTLNEELSHTREYLQRQNRVANDDLIKKNEQLVEYQRQLIKANHGKEEFLATMSHELRTPLATVIGNSEMILDGTLGDDSPNKLVSEIHQAGLTQLRLVDEVIEVYKIETDQLAIYSGPYQPCQLIDGLQQNYERHFSSRGLQWQTHCSVNLETLLLGDQHNIRKVLMALLGNAAKFTEQGGVTLSVEPRGDQLVYSVKDSGIGIANFNHKRIFERFEQLESALSRGYGGSGLGLYLARRIARLMEGEVEVNSQPGKGSCFELVLPLRESTSPIAETESGGGQGAQDKLYGEVLVVDDTPLMQSLIRRMLENRGLTVTVAGDGEEAVALASRQQFGLILMDIQMPVMDGLEATSALREKGCEVAIVALTANTTDRVREQFSLAGGDGYLLKPIDKQELMRVVERYLDAGASVRI